MSEIKQRAAYTVITLIGSLLVSAITTTWTVSRMLGQIQSDVRDTVTRLTALESEASLAKAQKGSETIRDEQRHIELITRLTRLETKIEAKP
mgnify:CR=1 FL=1